MARYEQDGGAADGASDLGIDALNVRVGGLGEMNSVTTPAS